MDFEFHELKPNINITVSICEQFWILDISLLRLLQRIVTGLGVTRLIELIFMTEKSLVFCCNWLETLTFLQDLFSFGTSFQDICCLLIRCICNPSQSVNKNARLTGIKVSHWSTLQWKPPGVNKGISPLKTEPAVAALPPPPLFKNCYGSAV